MRYRSTNHQAPAVSFREALLAGQAPDRGLYLPESFPSFSAEQQKRWPSLSYAALAEEILMPFVQEDLDAEALSALCQDAYNFPVPIEDVGQGNFILRLDQGPTASFKDFAARAMARMMSRFLAEDGRELLILTATSGDTGSAIAHAFYDVPGIQVVVLFPKDEVSERQRRLMTTLRKNIRSVSVDGKFDDCQAFVKRAFADDSLSQMPLSSANSINIGRLLPQSVYYSYAWAQITQAQGEMGVVVPCGNFGNIMGAWIARSCGAGLRHLVAAVNENDEFPRFLQSGAYEKIVPSRNCLSNAMNVGHPSNLARLVEVYGGQMDEVGTLHRSPEMAELRGDFFSTSVSDEETAQTMRNAYAQGVTLEPHGAVAWCGMQRYRQQSQDQGPVLIVETAHPAKFPEAMQSILGVDPELPASMREALEGDESFTQIDASYDAFHAYLMDTFGASFSGR
ncbi:MAG: threonine synthase [Myxococcales bacterium]|nr:threonine synthase [Myxococcales bacterium]MCB9643230.1 threonine synthase [Myxococcales bacterium]